MAIGMLPLSSTPAIPSIFTLFNWEHVEGSLAATLYANEDLVLCLLVVVSTWLFLVIAKRGYQPDRPGRLQNVLEFMVQILDEHCTGMLGKEQGRRYLPFLGGLFIYILILNLMGLIPFLMAPAAIWGVAVALALLTFLVVQWTALTKLGPLKYLYHLAGEPKGTLWLMAPLFFVIHIIGEFAKPVSLSLRLFGNVLGKDVLLGVFLAISVTISAAIGLELLPLPLHLPFMFLGLMLGAIQALVFFLLATVYIQMALPHGDHDESHGEEH